MGVSVTSGMMASGVDGDLSSRDGVNFCFPRLRSSLPRGSALVPRSSEAHLLFVHLVFGSVYGGLVFNVHFTV